LLRGTTLWLGGNLHVHAHVLVMDGVFTAADGGELTFHK
jgi:hypothetical protein